MKQGREIKKLGEVAIFVNGDRGKNYPSQHDFVDDGVPFINAGHLVGGSIDFASMNYISEEKYNQLGAGKIVNGDILFCLRGSLGKRAIVKDVNYGAIASSLVIIRSKNVLLNRYLFHYLGSQTVQNLITKNDNGSSQPNLSAKSVSDFSIPVPPREEQERIVAELDCLSGVIERKREQLRELDALAESIFYQMFGDPITNEKGWEVILLKQAALLKAGKAIKANELSEESDLALYPCYGGNGIRGYINKKSHNGQFPIIGRQGALCGNVVYAQGEFYATEHAVVCNNIIDSINPLWLYYALKFNNLNRYAQGVAQPGISVNIINEMPLIYPPLYLQQEFTDKIEAIEKQKELIKQSITQTEELFNSRMDYYFN